MYENMTVLSNQEYAELVIKAHKYDLLKEKAAKSCSLMDYEITIFELTQEELKAIEERRKKLYETL